MLTVHPDQLTNLKSIQNCRINEFNRDGTHSARTLPARANQKKQDRANIDLLHISQGDKTVTEFLALRQIFSQGEVAKCDTHLL